MVKFGANVVVLMKLRYIVERHVDWALSSRQLLDHPPINVITYSDLDLVSTSSVFVERSCIWIP